MQIRYGHLLWVLAVVLGASPVCGQVELTEVMFDPAGSEFYDEYIEVLNLGDRPVDLAGWRVGDVDETDAIRAAGQGTVLPAGAYGVILDAGYFGHSSTYDPLPDAALVLTVDGATLGREGLRNTHPERVLLISAAGDTVAAMAYRTGNPPGVSEEKIDLAAGDGPENWTDCRWAGGTPGRVNSVSQKARDLALTLQSESPVLLPAGARSEVALLVQNVGTAAVAGFRVRVESHALPGGWEWEGGALGAGDSVCVTAAMDAPLPGVHRFSAHAVFPADQDSTNNWVRWNLVVGVSPGAVVVNEVMAAPLPEGCEWVELLNRSDRSVDLAGWQIQDDRPGSATHISPTPFELAPGAFVVVAEDADRFRARFPGRGVLTPLSWPRLNNGGDAVVIKDATGTVVDSIVYEGGTDAGRSLERIDPDESGLDPQNWLSSTAYDGASPGYANSVLAPTEPAGIALEISPNPVLNQASITYRLPVRRARVNLWVFDRLGRRVRALLQDQSGGGQRTVVWDGGGDAGAPLKPGIYILYLEAGTPEGDLFRAREAVVLAGGI